MGEKTEISWTDSTWNPVSGCTKVSTGCKFCYAERVSKRMGQEFTKVTLHPNRLKTPVHWRKARRIFVCSMSDLFHKDVPDHFLDKVWAIMYQTPEHTYQVLTKRPERMREYVQSIGMKNTEHIWLGVSCENQEQADKRIPDLLQTPAAVRFVSLEPLLGPIILPEKALCPCSCYASKPRNPHPDCAGKPTIDWCIVGGESGGPPERALVEQCPGPGFHWKGDGPTSPSECAGGCNGTGWRSRAKALTWIRSIRDQCQAAGVSLHFKQFGGPRPKSGGRLLDGRTWDEYPS